MKPQRTSISSHDYDGIILDMLDDIVLAERHAKRLIDRIDGISQRTTLCLNIDSYLWILATVAVAAFMVGTFVGYAIHYWGD
ncbi:hypothetical protein [Ferrovum myxofaciens]|jgi:hypothetical protein|uniref:Uncharacterized protein n=1 Tax=Ferrovum myxofaciens TaxID=416213 RepID=A0A9E6MZ73_9PROT|nr:hypothetical protein [Ferrovum myxofaciens]QKE37577.1 MAG: hypothetical protein HO273_01515 [Ferrovum myxofaciens]QWY75232.1 MAG: hypothetical protein JVY19_01945 [Ferrovum myxofaciens]QWY77966.1 MAG: hypothetical protein JZL65_02445 [Ferrovum myxofaciens]